MASKTDRRWNARPPFWRLGPLRKCIHDARSIFLWFGMDLGWIFLWFWMDLGWILNDFRMNFGWIVDGFWLDVCNCLIIVAWIFNENMIYFWWIVNELFHVFEMNVCKAFGIFTFHPKHPTTWHQTLRALGTHPTQTAPKHPPQSTWPPSRFTFHPPHPPKAPDYLTENNNKFSYVRLHM